MGAIIVQLERLFHLGLTLLTANTMPAMTEMLVHAHGHVGSYQILLCTMQFLFKWLTALFVTGGVCIAVWYGNADHSCIKHVGSSMA